MNNRNSLVRPIGSDFKSRRIPHSRFSEEPMLDERDGFRPSDFVQRKLQSALPAQHIPVSTVHSHRVVRR